EPLLWLLLRLRRGRVFRRSAVPERGRVAPVPFLPRRAEFGDDLRLRFREVVLLTNVLREVIKLPAALPLRFKIAPVHEFPLPPPDGLLRAEAPVEGFMRRGGGFAGQMPKKVHAVGICIRFCASDCASGWQNVQRNHRLVIRLARGYFPRPGNEEGDADAAL